MEISKCTISSINAQKIAKFIQPSVSSHYGFMYTAHLPTPGGPERMNVLGTASAAAFLEEETFIFIRHKTVSKRSREAGAKREGSWTGGAIFNWVDAVAFVVGFEIVMVVLGIIIARIDEVEDCVDRKQLREGIRHERMHAPLVIKKYDFVNGPWFADELLRLIRPERSE